MLNELLVPGGVVVSISIIILTWLLSGGVRNTPADTLWDIMGEDNKRLRKEVMTNKKVARERWRLASSVLLECAARHDDLKIKIETLLAGVEWEEMIDTVNGVEDAKTQTEASA